MTSDQTADPTPHETFLDGQRHVWTIGDYPAVAERLMPISVDLVDSLDIRPGTRVLDVGAGTGNTAVAAAERGAQVTAVDLTPAQIEQARRRAAAAGLEIDLREGNAEALDLPDSAFDVVVSVMGAIFAPDHERAAAELARVCRPGGTVAITSWAREGGWFGAWRERAADLLPPPQPGAPEPDAWGDPDEAARRLESAGLATTVETRSFDWTFPSPEAGRDFFLRAAGPFVAFMESATAQGRIDEALATLEAALEETNRATDGTLRLAAPYLVTVGHR